MKVAIFFVLTALLGIASCDIVCMQFKLSSCFAVTAMRNFRNPICASNNDLIACLRNGARECGVESSPIVGEVIERYTETCKEGTEMNDLYKKHKACVFQDAAIGNGVCMRPILTEVLALGFPSQTRTYQENVLKVACKYGDSGNKCIDDNINSTCGAEAAKFRHHLSDPSVRLSDQACEEVAAETEHETNEIHYVLQQHDEHSVHAMSPHTQHLSATGHQAGSIQIASTVAPRQYPEPVSGANINSSLQIIYVLVAAICMKWFSY
ncbi:hypothetical protein AVEN_157107-1 [Araneus ventricosus]|uniref:DUF19 domain-containing protein n=1 Tax=Araneus ventricosus TaxID=182803 RepID=A0A4Y2HHK4_ARAVE|nr:hypothetical protein AVEN_157107-1 [Araneus ventricosus]